MLLRPTKKIPIRYWVSASNAIILCLSEADTVFKEHKISKIELQQHVKMLQKINAFTKNNNQNVELQENYVDVFRRILRKLPEYVNELESILHESWKKPINYHAKRIFGLADITNPTGLGSGLPDLPGYIPYILRKMILGQAGFLYMGVLKPGQLITRTKKDYDEYVPIRTKYCFSSQKTHCNLH